MERSTRIALAAGLALVIGAIIFVLLGNGIEYLSSLINGSPGYGLGASFVRTGYAIIAILAVVFVSAVGYLVYRATRADGTSWGSY